MLILLSTLNTLVGSEVLYKCEEFIWSKVINSVWGTVVTI